APAATPAAAAPSAPVAATAAPVSRPTSRPNGHAAGERVAASPLARRMATQAGIDLAVVKGTGPNGRIVRADIESFQKGAPAAPMPAQPQPPAARPPVSTPAASIAAPHRLVPHSSIRKVIARRLTEAKSTIPHFYVSMDVEIDALIAIQDQL